ncbi:hypothetical protein TNCV_2396191 [Trichonephila clavipes]|uniref:Uncharacterized protein n=1 Tax=Trichonephila clavipes TaxID=2585209 RepID=A0A8X6SVY5_TRICX|nr:hypothetical protein TNCV_2396191 [Trichonephila clavipes]
MTQTSSIKKMRWIPFEALRVPAYEPIFFAMGGFWSSVHRVLQLEGKRYHLQRVPTQIVMQSSKHSAHLFLGTFCKAIFLLLMPFLLSIRKSGTY